MPDTHLSRAARIHGSRGAGREAMRDRGPYRARHTPIRATHGRVVASGRVPPTGGLAGTVGIPAPPGGFGHEYSFEKT